MAIYDSFEDYREEIELSCVQNHGVELELYSIIAAVIREYCLDISLCDVSDRKRIKNDSFDLEGIGGFPDFVVLERILLESKWLGCIEAKSTYQIFEDHIEQIKNHIKSYGKVLYTNGLDWRFFDSTNEDNNWRVVIGYREGEKLSERKKNPIVWKEEEWQNLLAHIEGIRWN